MCTVTGWVGLLICHFTFRPSPAYNKCGGATAAYGLRYGMLPFRIGVVSPAACGM